MTRHSSSHVRLNRSLFILAAILYAGPVSAADTSTITFQIVDELGDGQIDETMAVSINSLPVGQVHVESNKPRDVLSVTVPEAPSYRYTLCGQLRDAGSDGKPQPHRINHGGIISGDIEGSQLIAVKSDDDVFYLAVASLSASSVQVSGITARGNCPSTVAMQ